MVSIASQVWLWSFLTRKIRLGASRQPQFILMASPWITLTRANRQTLAKSVKLCTPWMDLKMKAQNQFSLTVSAHSSKTILASVSQSLEQKHTKRLCKQKLLFWVNRNAIRWIGTTCELRQTLVELKLKLKIGRLQSSKTSMWPTGLSCATNTPMNACRNSSLTATLIWTQNQWEQPNHFRQF